MRIPHVRRGHVLLVLIGALAAGLSVAGCGSTRPPSAPSAPSAEQMFALIDPTPDSLAELPTPIFYRSATAHPGTPVLRAGMSASQSSSSSSPNTALPCPACTLGVEIIGGRTDRGAQWALLLRSTVPDAATLDTLSYVDLFGERILMRRGQAWRTLDSTDGYIRDTRLVPLARPDVRRLARSDTIKIDINRQLFRLPGWLRTDLQALGRTTPDSLPPDTAHVDTRFTVYHDPETEPAIEGGLRALEEQIEYPRSVRRPGIEGRVLLGFVITRRGTAAHLQVERSVHPLLDAAVVRAITRQSFEPGTHRGKPVPTWMTFSLSFSFRTEHVELPIGQ